METPVVLPPGGGVLLAPEPVEEGTYVLPARQALPQAAHPEVLEMFQAGEPEYSTSGVPCARLVHPNDVTEPPPADVYVLSDAHGLLHDPRRLVEVVTSWRERLLPDSALYLPAAATPQNSLLLVYLGADILDSTLVTLRAHQEIYLHPLGEWPLDSLRTLPCGCRHCAANNVNDLVDAREGERRDFLEAHNIELLNAQVRLASELLRRGGLRNALEGQALSDPLLASALRHLDRHPDYLDRRVTFQKRGPVLSCGQDSLNRPEVKLFRTRLMDRVSVPAKVAVLLPCSARKPYSTSASHRRFRRMLGRLPSEVREIIVSSPLGAVPRELEAAWPCAHYDAATTGYWDAEEVSIMAGVLKAYLEKIAPEEIVACLSGGYLKTAEAALDGMDVNVTLVTIDGLRREVRGAIESVGGSSRKPEYSHPALDAARCTADYQFGAGAGETLCHGAEIYIKSRRQVLRSAGEQLAAVSQRTGLLQLTVDGGRRMENVEPPCVEIDDFLPSGSVLAPGVLDADPEIRVGDEVIFRGPGAFGVGEARMAGWEMARATRGVAVQVRDVEGLK